MATLEPAVQRHPLSVPDGPGARARSEAITGLYVHVPFCAVRCAYCDFSSGALSAAAVERWFEGMQRECGLRAPDARGVAFTSVFFGGGTPSALPSRGFRRLVTLLRDHFAIAPGAEITLEANPETVKASLLDAWAEGGVNRLSMGAQSLDPAELARLGRIHDAERPGAAFALARAHGFRRLSLDLMFGFPGHGPDTWTATVERALELEPEHLSAYCYIPEDATPMGDAVARGAARLPSPEAQADLYEHLVNRVAAAGLAPYETSNFCRPDAECRHNLVYWLRRDSLGLGPAAHGLWRGRRHGNHYGPDRWAAELARGREPGTVDPETPETRSDEIVMLGLRLARGVESSDHAPSTWQEVRARYGAAFAAGIAEGRLERTSSGVRIPPLHRFVADDVIAWLMARADLTALEAAR